MFTEARKIHLLEEVLKTTNEATLVELENILNKTKKNRISKKKPSIYDFLGMLSKQEANQMRTAINEACETINPDDWK